MREKEKFDALELAGKKLVSLFDTYVTVRRKRFSVTVWKRGDGVVFRPVETFRCAIGANGYETTPGAYFIIAKALNPDWTVPNSPWAIEGGLTPGTRFEGDDPRNPIKAAFLKFSEDGKGFHGTARADSIGTKASHGCVRLSPETARWMYFHVPVGTPVLVV